VKSRTLRDFLHVFESKAHHPHRIPNLVQDQGSLKVTNIIRPMEFDSMMIAVIESRNPVLNAFLSQLAQFTITTKIDLRKKGILCGYDLRKPSRLSFSANSNLHPSSELSSNLFFFLTKTHQQLPKVGPSRANFAEGLKTL
jgi:hypothetical protein